MLVRGCGRPRPHSNIPSAAAFAAVALAILMFGFVVPQSVIVCGPPTAYVLMPTPTTAKVLPPSETDLVVTITAYGTLLIGHAIVPAQEFSGYLATLFSRTPDRRIVIRADKRSSFGAMRLVVRSAQSQGVRQLVIDSGVQMTPRR